VYAAKHGAAGSGASPPNDSVYNSSQVETMHVRQDLDFVTFPVGRAAHCILTASMPEESAAVLTDQDIRDGSEKRATDEGAL